MRTKKMYFCYNGADLTELHRLYGGKQYYSSRSGASGAGYFLPQENDLLHVPGGYRAHITHLSEAWPAEMFGLNVMVPVEGVGYNSPAVIRKNKIIYFLNNPEDVFEALLGNLPNGNDRFHLVEYRYLSRNGEIEKFSIPWNGGYSYDRNNRPANLPYSFEEFASLMGVVPSDIYPAETLEESVYFIEGKMHLKKTEIGLARIGYFGLPVEKIEGELFPQEGPRNFYSGWATQGFGSYQFAWKRVSNGEKVYAVIQAVPGQLNEKYSLLGDKAMEYEFLCENVLEWFSQPVEYWVEKMEGELTKKIRSEFLNSARWDESQQIAKVRELLTANPEAIFMIEDSLVVGNCRPGTESWMESFGIKEPMTSQQFLDHKRFEDMLQNSRFRAVILKKLFLDEEEEKNQIGHSIRRRISKPGPEREID